MNITHTPFDKESQIVCFGSIESVLVSVNSEDTGKDQSNRNELFALFAINSPVTQNINPITGIKFSRFDYENEVILLHFY